jgi:asparagine synthetase B (glutamine-hydrolysing)
MFGITGFIDFSNNSNNNSIIRFMTNSLKHRCPDGLGFWFKEKFNDHLAGKNDWHAHLWQVIVFQQWLENE